MFSKFRPMTAGQLAQTKSQNSPSPGCVRVHEKWRRRRSILRYQAALICVSLTPSAIGQWQALYNGRQVGVTRAIPFATTFIDLNCRMEMWVRGPFDYLHYYLSHGLLERIALDNGVSISFRLQEAFFIEDLVVAEMTKSILAPVEHGEPLDKLTLDHIAMVLGAHTLQAHCGMPKFARVPRRGLESWQKLRTEEMLRAHLEGNLTVKELASACSLSESHFARCFRISFGAPVHHRLISTSDRACQRPAFPDQQVSCRGCVAIGLLRPGRLYAELQPRGAHHSVTLAACQSRLGNRHRKTKQRHSVISS